jgi:hypothetical protein
LRQSAESEGLESRFTRKRNKILAQLLIDAKGRGLHGFGGLAHTGFISKKAVG